MHTDINSVFPHLHLFQTGSWHIKNMEQESFTSATIFAWHNGLRIVDLGQLARQMHCTQCSSLLDLNCIEKEEQFGLASILYILCRCGTVNDIYSGKNEMTDNGRLFEINIKASMSKFHFGHSHSILVVMRAFLMPSCSTQNIVKFLQQSAFGGLTFCSLLMIHLIYFATLTCRIFSQLIHLYNAQNKLIINKAVHQSRFKCEQNYPYFQKIPLPIYISQKENTNCFYLIYYVLRSINTNYYNLI